MTHEEILKKAVKKAMDNGWTYGNKWGKAYMQEKEGSDIEREIWISGVYANREEAISNVVHEYTKFIFSHEFAKAFYGTEEVNLCSSYSLDSGWSRGGRYTAWIHHLQQQVISDDPIKYMEKYL